ncbi:MAG: spore cortex biosynthesis protein YabQ [Lachnospiraceae bacterium]|nr:spore cortex biosynthesis protein YabQ [Lachnospiraceae bacterium]
MSAEIMGELDFLLRSMLLGVMITFLYDLIRIFRRVVRHHGFFVSLEDFFFWVFCSICIFLLLYRENNGILRWFVVMGAAVGMLLYKATVSRFLVDLAAKGIGAVLRLLGRIFRLLTKPLRATGRFLKKQLTRTWKMFRIILCKQ